MGIKNLSWEKIVGIVIIPLGFLSAIITIAKGWDVVLSILIFLRNIILEIPRFSISTIGRDVLLIILVGILFWLFRRSGKVRSTPQTGRSEEMEDWQYDWNLKHEFVLKKIADRTISYSSLYKLYERKFSDTSELELKVIMEDLEEVGLIRLSPHILRKKYEATRKGREFASKGLLVEMESRRFANQF